MEILLMIDVVRLMNMRYTPGRRVVVAVAVAVAWSRRSFVSLT
jgi:hypothetical protein